MAYKCFNLTVVVVNVLYLKFEGVKLESFTSKIVYI